jgi:hypothetical protein
MITLKQWMEVVGYRITEGNEYCWNSYGHNAYCLDSWNGDQNGHSLSITFDTQTQEVYEVAAHDYTRNRAYRLINPAYKAKHDNEAWERDVDAREAWDEVNYVDLETDEDFLDKAWAIVNDQEYDTRVEVPLTLEDEVLYKLMKVAHEQDITLNQLFENVLREEIDRVKLMMERGGPPIEEKSKGKKKKGKM